MQSGFLLSSLSCAMFFVYILLSEKTHKYYKGSTDNLEKRLAQHNAGESTYTKRDRPWKLAWFTETPTREAALLLERKLKNITSRERLEAFIKKYSDKGSTGNEV